MCMLIRVLILRSDPLAHHRQSAPAEDNLDFKTAVSQEDHRQAHQVFILHKEGNGYPSLSQAQFHKKKLADN